MEGEIIFGTPQHIHSVKIIIYLNKVVSLHIEMEFN